MGADPAAEEQFGPYLVYERLGVGGMATVHRALERGIEGFERVCALKRLLPHLAADASFIKSFVREAKLASLLNHINIVQIFECGRVGAEYFISMEYIDGRDIRRILRHARSVSGPPPIHVTVGLLLQLCDALDYAHHKADESGHPLGLVHRDVSPSNLLVTSAGRIKIIDFGIAKAQSAHLRTQTGRVKGKLAYMAPEALAGKELDARSDLFAVGVIGHELLTARPLFATKNEYQTLLRVQRGEIMPPSTFNQSCPPELDAIILRALARDPDERFLHASDLRDELDAMRRHYNLQAGERTVGAWLDWAFAVDAPRRADAGARESKTRIAPRSRDRSRIKRSDDDEAVEIAWGIDDHDGQPIVLDDVPDVTDKHLASASALGAEVRLDLDDLADDIPTPVPSHGARVPEAAVRAAESTPARPTIRAKRATPSVPLRAAHIAAMPGVSPAESLLGSDGLPTPNIGVGPSVRSVMIPPRPRTITRPPRIMPSSSSAPRNEPAASTRRGGDAPRTEPATVESDPVFTGSEPAHDTLTTERTPRYSVDDLGLPSDTIPSMPALRTSEPIVRFREPTPPPRLRGDPEPPRRLDTQPTRVDLPPARSHTQPGDRTEIDLEPAPPIAPVSRMITPATALFAEPEPDSESGVPRAAAASANNLRRPSSSAVPRSERAPRPPARPRVTVLRMLVLGGAIIVVAAAATAAALYAWRDREMPNHLGGPAPPPPRTALGTVQLQVTPADAAITIEGKPTHVGSPWTIDLAPGVYQIELQREGHKGWLTSIDVAAGQIQPLRVTLEPLGPAVAGDATLVIAKPAGLEVVLDGTPTAARTPIRRSLQPGLHTIVLRADGVDLWTKTLDAHASAIYELRPPIADPARPPAAEPPAPEPPAAEPAAPGPPSTPPDHGQNGSAGETGGAR